MADKKLFLIDGHAIAYRAYYAFMKTPLTNASGQPTGAVFGFAHYLLRLLQEYKCPYIAVVFDSSEPTFRHEMYKEYKANRIAMPDDLRSQFPLIMKMVDLFPMVRIQQPGLEADDILAHLTQKATAQGFEVFLVTRDKDLMQLVNYRVRMLSFENSGDIVVYDAAAVKEKMGVPPAQIRDLLALMGDASDNIPGVAGVGPKTARNILEKTGTIEKLLENPASLGNPKLTAKIIEHTEDLLLSQKLATLNFDVDFDLDIESLLLKPVNKQDCAAFFKEMEFNSLLKNPMFALDKKLEFSVTVPKSIDDVIAFTKKIIAAKIVAVDTETTSLVPHQANIVGISLAVNAQDAMYIPVAHKNGSDENLPLDKVLECLRPILESADIAKIGQNLKYDYQVFKNSGVTLKGLTFDAMVAGYVIDPGSRNFSLDGMAAQWIGVNTTPIQSLIGKGKNQKCFDEVPVVDAAYYSGEDVVLPFLLMEIFLPILAERNQSELFATIEMPLVSVLAEMEWAGIMLDTALLARMSGDFTQKLSAISNEIYALAGEELNLNSPKQISDILFVKLQLPKSKKTKTGLSTDVDALEKLQGTHPIIRKILDYREVQKLLSTYIDALGPQVLPETSRLHTSFNQTVTATGRLSSTGPNLQNIPVRTDAGKAIRQAFIAPPDYCIVSADYSQIELRILAHVSNDSFMVQSFLDDKDIHTQTASAVNGVFAEMVTPEMRRAAKTINFGLMYGMGPINLSRQLGISFHEAQHFIDAYFAQFPTIKKYMAQTIDKTKTCGFAETLLGRRRYLPDINSQNRQVREAAERTAINTPIQGTAADIIKIAMNRISKEAAQSGFRFTMLLQVHDELVFEVHKDDAEKFTYWACDLMSQAYTLVVPLKVDAKIGLNWSEAH
jgi:DNA polymerase-1